MSKRILAITDGSSSRSRRRSRSPDTSPDSAPRKRKSRWSAAETDRIFIPGMPTQLPPNLTPQQERVYIIQLQIEDMSRRLKSGDLGIPKNPEDRSPSPEPIYSSDGKRLNTREYRTRKKLEDDRHALVQQLMEINPEYKPPSDYKPPQNRITDKVFIPQDNHPDINFVGLLIGPRGNTLKALEKDTGAKVIIRGKGSVKEGKVGRRDGLPLPGEDEPLHAFISAPSAECVDKAVKKINEIIRQGIEIPESQNDLRRAQLRELALLNGTLREHEGLMKLRAMAEAQSIATNKIQCGICGGAGHLSTDCKALLGGQAYLDQLNANPSERAKMDSEYTALMAELGVGGGSQGLLSGLRGFNALQSQPARPTRQPPPPGVTTFDDDDDGDTVTNGTSATTTSTLSTTVSSPNQYAFALPPPPPPPAQYAPMMTPVSPWTTPAVVPPMPGYPSTATYSPGVPSATGAYPEVPTAINGSSLNQWHPSVPGSASWCDNSSQVPTGVPVAGTAMVPPYYLPSPTDYWAGYAGGYAAPIPNPPPPPPPGV
ncbi:Splicing factor 1 isoform 2 [Schistosoma japonicum]|uniref:Branchpoint-bridging protein n=1 Tax=Schistosoma japonicum TaxID=6182 RepID=A0A4Z2DTV8_SCHJA|nr:Splicing factor 1 isoform 2 [Schistosoma japonicum]